MTGKEGRITEKTAMEILPSKSKKALTVVAHLAGWALFVHLTFPRAGWTEPPSGSDFLLLLPFLAEYLLLAGYFYLNAAVFVPRLLSKKRMALFLAITVALFAFFCFAVPCLLRQYFLHVHAGRPFTPDVLLRRPDFLPPGGRELSPNAAAPSVFRRFGISSLSSKFLLVFIVSTGLKAISQWYAEKQRLQELEKSMVQAELSFLKSQIHPHFLFNSLNSIYYLALSKDDKAPEVILSLSSFLRFVTTAGNHSRIPLAREVKMLREYIHLQSLRASEKFELRLEVKGDFGEQEIMPLTFIPFVENAFKYGISAHIDCFVHVGVEAENGALLFTCDNSIVSGVNGHNRSTGVGLENIRKRLALAYPDRHRLDVHIERQAFHVKLQINPA
jgi:hypothetical protein